MQLTKIALITALLGILVLVFLSNVLEPRSLDISQITGKMIDNYVQISGEVTEIKNYDDFTVFSINDNTGKIKVIAYENLNLSGEVTLTGKVTSYKSMLEIEAEKIIEN